MKKKTIILIASLVILLGGATLLYRTLAPNYYPSEMSEDNSDADDKDSSEKETDSSDSSNEQPADDFVVYDKEGSEVTLSSQFDKPVVLNFWASWCGPCKSEMADFQEMYEQYGDDITFMMVNLTDEYSETQEVAEEYVNDQGFTFPVYFDKDRDAMGTYAVMSIPTTYIINSNGMITQKFIGAMSGDQLKEMIENELE